MAQESPTKQPSNGPPKKQSTELRDNAYGSLNMMQERLKKLVNDIIISVICSYCTLLFSW